MANLQVRDIDDRIYAALRQRAKRRHRSLSQEVVHIVEEDLARPAADHRPQSEMLLELCGSWTGPETASQIIDAVRRGRVRSGRFEKHDGLFD